MTDVLKAPFPYFGGKERVAELVWQRFGDPEVYIEPFCGSAAMLLARRSTPRVEYLNDVDRFVVNFWRAAQSDPIAVAFHADWPNTEIDLTARHLWLVNEGVKRLEAMDTNPAFYDAQVAGWWLWGACIWLGDRFCDGNGNWGKVEDLTKLRRGIQKKINHLGPARGVFRQIPDIPPGVPGYQQARLLFIREMIQGLADRLRMVKITCGDWQRMMTPWLTTKLGTTAVFLDPPYLKEGRHCEYNTHAEEVALEAMRWAIAAGEDPDMRIALCGYDGDYAMPDTWEVVAWKTLGGYGREGSQGTANRDRERIWFSPHCVRAAKLSQVDLFSAIGALEVTE